jgi:peroxiredoxin
MGRILGTLVILALLVLAIGLPYTSLGRRGSEAAPRRDAPDAVGTVGERLPKLSLEDLDGKPVSLADFRGQRVVLIFERSLDWCPFSKARLVELRQQIQGVDDVVILYVLPDNQINDKTHFFIEGNRLTDRVIFLQDAFSSSIDRLGLRRPNREMMETGVPHPSTYVLDRKGVVRFVDIRQDFHIWLDHQLIFDALDQIS